MFNSFTHLFIALGIIILSGIFFSMRVRRLTEKVLTISVKAVIFALNVVVVLAVLFMMAAFVYSLYLKEYGG